MTAMGQEEPFRMGSWSGREGSKAAVPPSYRDRLLPRATRAVGPTTTASVSFPGSGRDAYVTTRRAEGGGRFSAMGDIPGSGRLEADHRGSLVLRLHKRRSYIRRDALILQIRDRQLQRLQLILQTSRHHGFSNASLAPRFTGGQSVKLPSHPVRSAVRDLLQCFLRYVHAGFGFAPTCRVGADVRLLSFLPQHDLRGHGFRVQPKTKACVCLACIAPLLLALPCADGASMVSGPISAIQWPSHRIRRGNAARRVRCPAYPETAGRSEGDDCLARFPRRGGVHVDHNRSVSGD